MGKYWMAATVFFLLLLGAQAGHGQAVTERPDFERYFAAAGLRGALVIYDQAKDEYIYVNPERCRAGFLPASTFKIANALIGLDSGVIPDADYILPWDGVTHGNRDWNRDHTLRSAMQYSVVWYYQELARRVGAQDMQAYLERLDYGNRNMAGGIDRFWLTGGLRISAEQQIGFLRRLHDETLPVSQRALDQVKEMMIREKTDGRILRAKTGWADEPQENVGWYVGYIEQGANVYYFATVLTAQKPVSADFIAQRIQITHAVLKDLEIEK